MSNDLTDSQKLSDTHKKQRDCAITERDLALQERDSARLERDDFKDQNLSLESHKVAQDLFVATLSHDLRNPISAIKMAVEIVKENQDPILLREMMDLIDRNADQAGELINHLLDAHLIRSGSKLPVELKDCDLLPILEKCKQSLGPKHQSKIVLNSDNKTEIRGHWDSSALERAFKNLISNAIKFADSDTLIKINIWQETEITSISVQNFGQLISLENQLRIFDSQIRIQQAEPQHKKGWGLGLTLVRGVAEAHSGKVEVTSNRTEGTTFTLRLPTDLRKS